MISTTTPMSVSRRLENSVSSGIETDRALTLVLKVAVLESIVDSLDEMIQAAHNL
jgi:hypothetical protein